MGVQRHGDGAVPEHLLDDFRGNLILEQQLCQGVAEVVEAKSRQAGLAQNGSK